MCGWSGSAPQFVCHCNFDRDLSLVEPSNDSLGATTRLSASTLRWTTKSPALLTMNKVQLIKVFYPKGHLSTLYKPGPAER